MIVCRKKIFFLSILSPFCFAFPGHSTFKAVTRLSFESILKGMCEVEIAETEIWQQNICMNDSLTLKQSPEFGKRVQ